MVMQLVVYAARLDKEAKQLIAQKRYDAAAENYKTELVLLESALGPKSPQLAVALDNVAEFHRSRGRFADAEQMYLRAIDILQDAKMPYAEGLGTVLLDLGHLYAAQHRDEAEEVYARAVAAYARVHGLEHAHVALGLATLGRYHYDHGRFDRAEMEHRRALEIRERVDPNGPDVAASLVDVAETCKAQGRFKDAEPAYERALSMYQQLLGTDDVRVAVAENGLGMVYRQSGRYREAEVHFLRARMIHERKQPTNERELGAVLDNLGELLTHTARLDEAEQLLRRSIALGEKLQDTVAVSVRLNNLAQLYRNQGRFAEAESQLKRSLELVDRPEVPDPLGLAVTLGNLGSVYHAQFRLPEAEHMLRRSVELRKGLLGPRHVTVALALRNLALVCVAQRKLDEADALQRTALSIAEETLGPDHPDVAGYLGSAAMVALARKNFSEGVAVAARSLAIREKALGPDHPDVTESQALVAIFELVLGRYGAAETHLRQAITSNEKTLGPDHPETAQLSGVLASAYAAEGRIAEGLPWVRRATANLAKRHDRRSPRMQELDAEFRAMAPVFLTHVAMLSRYSTSEPAIVGESFETAQLAHSEAVGLALSQAAARLAAAEPALRAAISDREDALRRWRSIDAFLASAIGAQARDRAEDTRQRAEAAKLDAKLVALDERLAKDFPKYQELASPKPLTMAEVQALLKPREALVAYLVGKDESWIWVVRPELAHFRRLASGADVVRSGVERLRRSLQFPGAHRGLSAEGGSGPFDIRGAHELYDAILGEVAADLVGVAHLMVVPDGALQSLPFAALVTGAATEPRSAKDLQHVPWLMDRHALTMLPSVGTLAALRRVARTPRAQEPFVGFGDPALQGRGGTGTRLTPRAVYARGGVDVEAVRRLEPLPETADELRAMATALGATPNVVHLRAEATEARVRDTDLERFRVLAFSTHGLMAGEFRGLSEPALVLTPPSVPTPQDDGLLAASEIAELKMDADWVILSACNTAAPDGTPGAEGLTGLAKSFFYSGARTLLVSHWSVHSVATQRLMTLLIQRQAGRKPGKAEALRQVMRQMLDEGDQEFAHPYYWAPFVVVGEGI
jgi:CHAT domain-containing protein/Tfp pilus assembly protein PilF